MFMTLLFSSALYIILSWSIIEYDTIEAGHFRDELKKKLHDTPRIFIFF